jgi:hypothetical protein
MTPFGLDEMGPGRPRRTHCRQEVRPDQLVPVLVARFEKASAQLANAEIVDEHVELAGALDHFRNQLLWIAHDGKIDLLNMDRPSRHNFPTGGMDFDAAHQHAPALVGSWMVAQRMPSLRAPPVRTSPLSSNSSFIFQKTLPSAFRRPRLGCFRRLSGCLRARRRGSFC